MPFFGGGLGQLALVFLWGAGAVVVMRLGSSLTARLLPANSPLAAPLGLPLGLAIIWVVSFWIGHVLSLLIAAALGLLTLVVAAGLARRRWGDQPLRPRGFTVAVAVFAVAFLFMIAIRALDPAVHPSGGEKFLDFGLLNSLLRTSSLPPEDMWFAGEPVSYYYGGHLVVAQIARLTATPPEYAYNLALAGFYATLVTTAYGVAAGIADRIDAPARLAGGFAAFFVGFASNLATPLHLDFALLPTDLATDLAGALGYQLTGLAGGLDRFSYWTASRVIEGTINEFPLFAWLNGDMHAHMMSTSFTLLAVGLLAAYAWSGPERRWRRRLVVVVGLLPALAGMVAVMNTWSLPTIGGLTLLGLYFAEVSPRTLLPQRLAGVLEAEGVLSNELLRLGVATAFGAFVVVGGVIWSTPFWLESATSRPLGLFPERSPLGGLLLVHGVFLLLFSTYLLRMAGARAVDARRGAVLGVLVLGLGAATGLFAPTALVLLLVLGWFVLRAEDVSERLSAVRVGGGVRSAADGGDRTLPRPSFETVLIVAGLGLVLLVEFAHVDEGGAFPRFNTVFKVYMQVWILFGTAAGVVVARLLTEHRPALPLSGGRWRPALRGLTAVLVVATSIYGGFALVNHVEGTPLNAGTGPTLDATAFVDAEHPREAPAIEWIDDLRGQPTIVTAAPGGYSWAPDEGNGASAPASLTGVPTVLGWFHEAQYRGEAAYRPRVEAVRTIYTGTVAAQSDALRTYDVEYVYVGPAERAQYDQITIGDHPAVHEAAVFDSVTIYGVEQSAVD